MKSITITKKNATILHDGLLAVSPEGQPVFILPAPVGAPQLSVHPKGMLVFCVPEQQFPEYVHSLLQCKEKHLTFPVRNSERVEGPKSGLRAHAVDLSADTSRKHTG